MNKQIMEAAGFKQAVIDVQQGKCPFCGKRVKMGDFRDPLSIREYQISGLCQSCQDDVFSIDECDEDDVFSIDECDEED